MTDYKYRERKFVTSPEHLHAELDLLLADEPDSVKIQTLIYVKFDFDAEESDKDDDGETGDIEYLVTARYSLPDEEEE
jgi:hypothetical protein